MGKYFTISELTYSSTAKKHKVDNTPSEEEIKHIEELIVEIDGLRAAWGSALIVASGFRCPKLNELVGGAKKSGHQTGYAVDLIPANNKKREFYEFCKEYFKDKDFDELLLEKNSKGSVWTHFSLKSFDGKQRKKVKELEVK
jgi:hypothetical protein